MFTNSFQWNVCLCEIRWRTKLHCVYHTLQSLHCKTVSTITTDGKTSFFLFCVLLFHRFFSCCYCCIFLNHLFYAHRLSWIYSKLFERDVKDARKKVDAPNTHTHTHTQCPAWFFSLNKLTPFKFDSNVAYNFQQCSKVVNFEL